MTSRKPTFAERLNIGSEVRELKLGRTFDPKRKTSSFHTLKYDFKPASVDRNKKAAIEFSANNQVTVTVPNVESSGVAQTVYKGNHREYTRECLLIFNKKTGEITVERLEQNIQVKKTRGEKPNPTSAAIPIPMMAMPQPAVKRKKGRPANPQKQQPPRPEPQLNINQGSQPQLNNSQPPHSQMNKNQQKRQPAPFQEKINEEVHKQQQEQRKPEIEQGQQRKPEPKQDQQRKPEPKQEQQRKPEPNQEPDHNQNFAGQRRSSTDSPASAPVHNSEEARELGDVGHPKELSAPPDSSSESDSSSGSDSSSESDSSSDSDSSDSESDGDDKGGSLKRPKLEIPNPQPPTVGISDLLSNDLQLSESDSDDD